MSSGGLEMSLNCSDMLCTNASVRGVEEQVCKWEDVGKTERDGGSRFGGLLSEIVPITDHVLPPSFHPSRGRAARPSPCPRYAPWDVGAPRLAVRKGEWETRLGAVGR